MGKTVTSKNFIRRHQAEDQVDPRDELANQPEAKSGETEEAAPTPPDVSTLPAIHSLRTVSHNEQFVELQVVVSETPSSKPTLKKRALAWPATPAQVADALKDVLSWT